MIFSHVIIHAVIFYNVIIFSFSTIVFQFYYTNNSLPTSPNAGKSQQCSIGEYIFFPLPLGVLFRKKVLSRERVFFRVGGSVVGYTSIGADAFCPLGLGPQTPLEAKLSSVPGQHMYSCAALGLLWVPPPDITYRLAVI